MTEAGPRCKSVDVYVASMKTSFFLFFFKSGDFQGKGNIVYGISLVINKQMFIMFSVEVL